MRRLKQNIFEDQLLDIYQNIVSGVKPEREAMLRIPEGTGFQNSNDNKQSTTTTNTEKRSHLKEWFNEFLMALGTVFTNVFAWLFAIAIIVGIVEAVKNWAVVSAFFTSIWDSIVAFFSSIF